MKQGTNLFIFLLLLSSCTGVGEQQVRPAGTHHVAYDQLVFEFQYLPHTLILKNEGLTPGDQPEDYKRRQNELEGTAWFLVRFSTKDSAESPLRYQVTELSQYNERLSYFNNLAAKDFSMLYGGDRMPVNNYWFENNYNLMPWETILISFKIPDPEPIHDLQLSYQDRIFRNGIIKSRFTAETIESLQ